MTWFEFAFFRVICISFLFFFAFERTGKIRFNSVIKTINNHSLSQPNHMYSSSHVQQPNRSITYILQPFKEGQVQSIRYFIGIITAVNHFDLRETVRNTWLNYHSLCDGQWTYRFIMGSDKSKNETLKQLLLAESKKYKDLYISKFEDNYHNLAIKTLHFFDAGHHLCSLLKVKLLTNNYL